MRVLLIGQAPSAATDGMPPFSGRSGERLAGLAGLRDAAALREAFEVRNLFDKFPGKAAKGDRFPLGAAREEAARLRGRIAGGGFRADRALLVGVGVARAFGVDPEPLLTWRTDPRLPVPFAVLPHPSGVNLWWNLPRHVLAASRFLRAAARASAEGDRRAS